MTNPDCAMVHPWGECRHTTIRESTDDERNVGWGPHPLAGGLNLPNRVARRFVIVDFETDDVWFVFGLPEGGDTREEAVFWAERLASKNGLHFIRPEDWEDVVGRPPETSDTRTVTREQYAATLLDAIEEARYRRGRLSKVTVEDMVAILDLLDAVLPPSSDSGLRAALETIAGMTGSMPPAWNDELGWYRSQFYSAVGVASRALAASPDSAGLDVCPDCGLTAEHIGQIHITAQRAATVQP